MQRETRFNSEFQIATTKKVPLVSRELRIV